MDRSGIRANASRLGLLTSGNNQELEALTECAALGVPVPGARQSKASYLDATASRYARLLEGVTLSQLAQCFPESSWASVQQNGWATVPMDLLLADRRFLKVCLYTNLADLGVSPEHADTYASAQGDRSYDSGHGWLRRPAMTPPRPAG